MLSKDLFYFCAIPFFFATMTIPALYKLFLQCQGVCIDTRTLAPGDLFISIVGPNFDGNRYAQEAVEKGAKYAVVTDQKYESETCIYVASDGGEVLRQLAILHRQSFDIPVIGLTGSNGKTTSKELIYAVLSAQYRVHATAGNLNNHLGVPLTILRMPASTEIALVEMGANHQREIAYLSEICQPTIGYITNIGKAHLEGFGGETGVYIGKKELFDYLARSQGLAFVNADDQKVLAASAEVAHRVNVESSTLFEKVSLDGNQLQYCIDGVIHKTQLTGIYNRSNIGIAIEIARYFEVPERDIHSAISAYLPTNHRSQVTVRGNQTIVVDSYNANPDSMAASLDNFKLLEGDRRLVILGEMLELGTASLVEHQKIIDQELHQSHLRCLLVGNSWATCNTYNYPIYSSTADLLADKVALREIEAATHVLLKGSRGVALEQVLHVIQGSK